jgi:hypothetical protein
MNDNLKYGDLSIENKHYLVVAGAIDILSSLGILNGGGDETFLTPEGRTCFDHALREKELPDVEGIIKGVMAIVHPDTPFDVAVEVAVLLPLVVNNTIFDLATWSDEEQTDFVVSRVKQYVMRGKFPEWLKMKVNEEGKVITELQIPQKEEEISDGDSD